MYSPILGISETTTKRKTDFRNKQKYAEPICAFFFMFSFFKISNKQWSRFSLLDKLILSWKHYVYIWGPQKFQNRDLKTKQVIDQKYTWTHHVNFIWLGEFSVNFQRPLPANEGPLEGHESRRGIFVSPPPLHLSWYSCLCTLFTQLWEGESSHMQLKFYL